MLSRNFGFACVAVLGASLPGAQGFAQETPQIQGLRPTIEEDQAEFIRFGASVGINGRTALVGIPDTWQRIAVFARDENGTWVRTGSIEAPDQGGFGEVMAVHGKRLAVASSGGIQLYEQQGIQWHAQSFIRLPSNAHFPFPTPLAFDGKTLALTRLQPEIDPVTGLQSREGSSRCIESARTVRRLWCEKYERRWARGSAEA